jgi:hypothetical protein
MKLIDKSAIVVEIERRLKVQNKDRDFNYLQIKELEAILSFLDTLEVKEVDLDRAIDKWIDDAAITHEDCSITDIKSTAKYFFELGMQQSKNN